MTIGRPGTLLLLGADTVFPSLGPEVPGHALHGDLQYHQEFPVDYSAFIVVKLDVPRLFVARASSYLQETDGRCRHAWRLYMPSARKIVF